MVPRGHGGAPGGFALPHAEDAGGARPQRRSLFRERLESNAVFQDRQQQLLLERRCPGPGPGPGLSQGQGKGRLRGPRRSTDPRTLHGRPLLSWKKLENMHFYAKIYYYLSKDVKSMFIYAAVNSENDILWLLKLRLSLRLTSCLKKAWKSGSP